MSTVSPWKCATPFGAIVCVEEYDIDSITPADYDSDIGFIRDLTLADAMKLYWLWESAQFTFYFSGTVGAGTIITLDYDSELAPLPTYEPTDRVCLVPGLSCATEQLLAITIENPPFPAYSESFTVEFLLFPASLSTRSPVGSGLTKQADGKYTLWYAIYSYHDAGYVQIASEGEKDFSWTTIGTNTFSVESGQSTLRLVQLSGSSSGSLGTFEFAPNYYTVS